MDAKNPITTATDDARDLVDRGTEEAGSVVLRGVTVPLDSDVAEMFVADCVRNLEGLLSDLEIKVKYELTTAEWERLADSKHLLRKLRAERDRRILSGEAAREAAQRHFVKAPHVLHRILVDDQMPPRHRIEAARELRQAAGNGPNTPEPGQKFKIIMNLGADETFVREFTPNFPALPPDDGEA